METCVAARREASEQQSKSFHPSVERAAKMRRWGRIAGAVLALALIGGEVARAEVITPAAALVTTNWPDRTANELINGGGLTTVGPVASWTHAPNGGAAAMWHAGTQVGGLGGVAGNPPVVNDQAIVFTMPGSVDLTGSYIWQMAQNATRGVKDFEILYTSDADPLTATYTSLGAYTLNAPLLTGEEPVQIKNFAANGVRHIKFDINSAPSGAANDYVGLSEVRFEGTIIQPLNPQLQINRQTGELTIRNNSINTADLNFIAYSILSNTNGSLNSATWSSIADRDANSGGSVDPTDAWVEFTAAVALQQFERRRAAGRQRPFAPQFQSVAQPGECLAANTIPGCLGAIAASERHERRSFGLVYGQRHSCRRPERFWHDHSDGWPLFRAGMGGSYSSLSKAQAYLMGDLDGDLDSDLSDFAIFKIAYDVDNGAGAFDAMVSAVPEPATWALALACVGLLGASRRRMPASVGKLAAIGAMLVVATLPGVSQAAVLNLAGLPAFSSSNFDLTQSFVPGNAFDGNVATRWASGAPLGTVGGAAVDLRRSWPGLPAPEHDTQLGNFQCEHLQRARTNIVQGDPGGAAANPVDGIWRPIAGAAGLGGIPGGGAPGADQLFNYNLGTGTAIANVGGTLTVNEYGPIARYLMIQGVLESTSGGSLYSVWEVTVDGVNPITPLELSVNKSNGQVTIKNDGAGAQSLAIDGYQILSPTNSLKTAGWGGLGAVPGLPLGNGTGNGWEKGQSSGTSRLEEGYLIGNSPLGISGEFALGSAYNPAVGSEDLVFQYSIAGVGIRTGIVTYETGSPINGDYNSNGIVDIGDYTVWRDNLGQPAASLPNRDPGNSGLINQADYTYWKSRFGATSNGAGGVAAVPEPASLLLMLGAWACLGRTHVRHRGRP